MTACQSFLYEFWLAAAVIGLYLKSSYCTKFNAIKSKFCKFFCFTTSPCGCQKHCKCLNCNLKVRQHRYQCVANFCPTKFSAKIVRHSHKIFHEIVQEVWIWVVNLNVFFWLWRSVKWYHKQQFKQQNKWVEGDMNGSSTIFVIRTQVG